MKGMLEIGARKAQSSMILIILVLLIFAGLVVFLLGFVSSVSQPEYTNLYVSNLLLSVMRSDTGYMDSKCKLVSDSLSCAFFEPNWRCAGTGPACLELANDTITGFVGSFEMVQENYRYLFIASPEYLTGNEVLNPVTDKPLRIKVGDLALEGDKVAKITANHKVTKNTRTGPMIINVQLIVSQKEE